MQHLYRTFALLLCGVLALNTAQAQLDGVASLPYANHTLVNPAFSGLIEGTWGFAASHRVRQATEADQFSTTTFSGDYAINTKKLRGGAGFLFQRDLSGGIMQNAAQISFAYEAPLGAKARYTRLRIGAQAGLIQRSINKPSILTEDAFSSVRGSFDVPSNDPILQGLTGAVGFDASLGIMFYRTQKIKGNPELNYYIGGAMYHVSAPKIGFFEADAQTLSPRYVVTAGLKYRTRSSADYNLNVTWNSQNNSQVAIAQAFVRLAFFERNVLFGTESAAIIAGATTRLQLNTVEGKTQTLRTSGMETLAPFLGLEYNKIFSFGIAYDIVVSKEAVVSSSYGGVMFTAAYTLGYKKISKKFNALPFPSF